MGDTLNLFPSRAAIGKTDATGNVYMTVEFSRALAALLVRVGGPVSGNLGDVALEVATGASAVGLHLARAVEELERQIAQATHLAAALGELRKLHADLERASVNVAAPVDWEHPGKIGARTANSGQFTTVNGVHITAPAAPATLTLADGKTLTVTNTLQLAGLDGATLDIGGGGGLRSAAYTDAATFALQNGSTATDFAAANLVVDQKFACNGKAAQGPKASGGTLAGVISALVANGILSS